MTERAVEIRHSAADDMHAAAALFHDPRYVRLLGKATGAGIGAGILARRVPALGLPIALLAGIYLGLELAAYLAEAGAPADAIDAVAIEREEITRGDTLA
ncbi:MAG: hypothetical protein M0Z46_19990 [Actinomycetota bacterium]|jgi:hypothetical protein|nr:hypothetical protein [Actinomycetota bacterium]